MPPANNPAETLVSALRRRKHRAGEPKEVVETWSRLADDLEAIGIPQTVGACARESHEVARYSLVTGHDWHTWTVPPADEPRPRGAVSKVGLKEVEAAR